MLNPESRGSFASRGLGEVGGASQSGGSLSRRGRGGERGASLYRGNFASKSRGKERIVFIYRENFSIRGYGRERGFSLSRVGCFHNQHFPGENGVFYGVKNILIHVITLSSWS